MSAPIGPGDWVECVDTDQRYLALPPIGLKVGAVYSVAHCDRALASVLLDQVRSQHPSGMFRADHFRPVCCPDETLIERLLEGMPETVRDLETIGSMSHPTPEGEE